MIEPPDDYEDIDETVMSNFDHSIDRSLEERLRKEKVICQFTALNFCGNVWHERIFYCQIHVHGLPRQIFSAETLEELKEMVCSEYGHE